MTEQNNPEVSRRLASFEHKFRRNLQGFFAHAGESERARTIFMEESKKYYNDYKPSPEILETFYEHFGLNNPAYNPQGEIYGFHGSAVLETFGITQDIFEPFANHFGCKLVEHEGLISRVEITSPSIFFRTLEHGITKKNRFDDVSFTAINAFKHFMKMNRRCYDEEVFSDASNGDKNIQDNYDAKAVLVAMQHHPEKIDDIAALNNSLGEDEIPLLNDAAMSVIVDSVKAEQELRAAMTGIDDEKLTNAMMRAIEKDYADWHQRGYSHELLEEIESRLGLNAEQVGADNVVEFGRSRAAQTPEKGS